MIDQFRRWMRDPLPELPSEFTWGACVLMFLTSILLIGLILI